jgi:hypothetical protein
MHHYPLWTLDGSSLHLLLPIPKTKYKIIDPVKFLKTPISKNILASITKAMTWNLDFENKIINNKISKGVRII